MHCERCGIKLTADDDYVLNGVNVCEDCYIASIQPKRCDVTAVYSAKMHRKMAGHTGTEGLTELQKDIYDYVKEHGQVTSNDLSEHFKVPISEIEKQITVLRHCELLKGSRAEGKVVVTIMDGGLGTLNIE